jgi:DNA-binding NarL/FixJ family response regulator
VTIKVLVADDQSLVRAGLVMLLSAVSDIDVVGEATDGEEAVQHCARLHPDVVLMDVRMDRMDGVEATRLLCQQGEGKAADVPTRVLVLTTFDDDEAIHGALRAGASGYLLKHAAPQDLVAAVRAVYAGEAWLDPRVAGRVIKALARQPDPRRGRADALDPLTPREREVLAAMALGLSNADIADRFVLAEATVKTHVSRILLKTGSRDRAQAVALAYQSGLVKPE